MGSKRHARPSFVRYFLSWLPKQMICRFSACIFYCTLPFMRGLTSIFSNFAISFRDNAAGEFHFRRICLVSWGFWCSWCVLLLPGGLARVMFHFACASLSMPEACQAKMMASSLSLRILSALIPLSPRSFQAAFRRGTMARFLLPFDTVLCFFRLV